MGNERTVPAYSFTLQVILGVEYDKAVDMWSIGVITFELLSQGVLPFPGRTESEIGA